MANELVPVGSRSTPLVADAAVGDEIATAGMGLGQLVLRTGQAIAETQNQLNDTSADTATALAETLADVIAVQEKVYRDDGTLDSVQTHTRQLPLINFIDPVFYQWTNVRLQGRFYAKEFAAESASTRTEHTSRSGSSQHGLLVILGGGRTYRKYHGEVTRETREETRDISFGQVRMNALLEPRADVGVPKPNQAIQGPRLSLIHGEILDVMEGTTITARTMSLLIQYNRRSGEPIPGKPISIESNGVSWSFTGDAVTNADGQIEILLRREFLDEEADRTPADFVVSARIGLVQNTTTVTF